jgi:predicted nucleic acid-binding protein
VVERALLDTGFVVALVNAADPDHDRCVAVWKELRVGLLSVEGVIVESAHMLRHVRRGVAAAVRLIQDAGTRVVPMTRERSERALALMEKYQDVPMDWVDACLVALAEEERVADVLTLDRRGFSVYRLRGRQRFHVRP